MRQAARDGSDPETEKFDAEGRWPLPDGWVWTRVGRAAEVNPKTTLDTIEPDEEIPFVPMAAVSEEAGAIDISHTRRARDVTNGYVRFRQGDVIFAKITPCMENGKIAPVPPLPHGVAAGSTEFHVVRPLAAEQKYLWYWLVNRTFRGRAKRRMSGSAGQLRVPADFVRGAPVPLAPLAEQRRIVERIDALFAEIEKGERALREARAGLETYRRALLKAAVTGELTRDWREKHKPTETGHDLLARIRVERTAKAPAKARSRRPAPPAPSDTTELPALPEGWAWAELAQLAWSSSYGTSVRCSADAGGPPVLRIPNVRSGKIVETESKFATASLDIEPTDFVAPGDLLIIRTNGSEALIGRGGLVLAAPRQPTYFASYLIRFRLLGGGLTWHWVSAFFESPILRHWMMDRIASSAGQYNVSQASLASLVVPIPGHPEMGEATRRLSDALSAISDTRALSDAAAADAARLRQSILKAAFEGRLVPQDPNDEPASALLARLKPPADERSRRAGRRRVATASAR